MYIRSLLLFFLCVSVVFSTDQKIDEGWRLHGGNFSLQNKIIDFSDLFKEMVETVKVAAFERPSNPKKKDEECKCTAVIRMQPLYESSPPCQPIKLSMSLLDPQGSSP